MKLWSLLDYKTAKIVAGKSHLSVRLQHQYDCREELTRVLSHTAFSGHMGKGEVLYTNSDEGKWEPVPPDSVAHNLLEYACSK